MPKGKGSRKTMYGSTNIMQSLSTEDEAEHPAHEIPSGAHEGGRTANPVIRYFRRLAEICSVRYLLYFAIVQLVTCGLLISLVGSLFLPVFKRLGVDAATEQLLQLLCWMPYSMSPLFGIVSDVLPFFGYHKKYYVVFATVASALGCLSLMSSVPRVGNVVLGLVAMNVQIAVLNLLNEGKFSEIMRRHPDAAADITTFNQALSAIGSLIAMSFVGPLSDNGEIRRLLQIALGLALLPLAPAVLGWLPERRRSPNESGLSTPCCARGRTRTPCFMIDRDRLQKHRGNVQIALLVGLGGPALAAVGAYAGRWLGFAFCTLALAIIVGLSYKTLPRVVANLAGYTVLTRASAPSLRAALQYFYTANEDCWPEGPHFSYTYYISFNGIVGEIVMLVAIVIYQMFMTKWSYRFVLSTTLFLQCAGNFVDVILVKRWNLAIGIPDDIFFLFGSSVLESLTSMLHLMPFTALLGKMCPPGSETSTFSLVSGLGMFAMTWSTLVGSTAMDMAGLRTTISETTGGQCDFSPLPALILSLSIVMPALVGALAIFFLIPSALQTDPVINNYDDVNGGDCHRLPTSSDDDSPGVFDNEISDGDHSFEEREARKESVFASDSHQIV